jgi:hypothetical protein
MYRDAGKLCWRIIANRLQAAGKSLQKMFGPAAAKVLNEAIEDCGREVHAAFFSDGDTINLDADRK